MESYQHQVLIEGDKWWTQVLTGVVDSKLFLWQQRERSVVKLISFCEQSRVEIHISSLWHYLLYKCHFLDRFCEKCRVYIKFDFYPQLFT